MNKLIKDLMTTEFIKVNEDEEIYKVVSKVAAAKSSLLACVVDKEGKISGIITPKEILKAVEVCGYDQMKRPLFSGREVAHIMTSRYAKDIMSDPVFAKSGDDVQQAIDIMIDRGFYEVPVVDDDSKLVGLVDYFAVISSADWQCDTGR
ncbi:MAG: CBS domain-containing protein [Dehalococcoidia bacterium]|jgi:predicted transcriptional regulator